MPDGAAGRMMPLPMDDGALIPELYRTNAAGQVDPQGDLAAALTTASDPCYQILLEPVCVTGQITHALTSEGADASEDGTGRGTPLVAFGGNNTSGAIAVAPALLTVYAVRRLTPTEAELLQGFPRDHTRIPYRRKPAADAPRYRALGNSMAVPCMRWLGERIQQSLALQEAA